MFSSFLESFSWRWAGRLWFFAIFSSPFLGAPTFLLYSPFWLILALYLLVRQALIFVSIPSTVPSNFLLVANIEVYTVQTSFLINRIWALADAFNAEGTRFPWFNPTPCFLMGPPSTHIPFRGLFGDSPHQDVGLPIEALEYRGQGSISAVPLGTPTIDYPSSAKCLLGMGFGPR